MTEQILATIVAGAHRVEEIHEFLDSTFYAYQNPTELAFVKEELENILTQLEETGFITVTNGEIRATDFGALSSRLYLSMNSALGLKAGIKSLGSGANISEFDLLILLCMCEEVIPLKVKDAMEIARHLSNSPDWVCSGTNVVGSAIVAHAWIDEMTYPEMKVKFGIYPGEIHNTIYVLGWICYAASRIAEHLRAGEMYTRLSILTDRVRYGARTELLSLVSIKGVGRVIARSLYSAGIRSMEEVASADVTQLERVPGVGRKRAARIKEEAARSASFQ
jgi:helicase